MSQEAIASVEQVILDRHSPRTFAATEIAAADLEKIFEASRWAASSYNEQPWRFLIGRKGDRTYQKIFDSLVEFNQGWAKTAPLLILSVGSRKFAHNGTANRYALYDTGAATAYLMLQAFALGVHSHSMGGFDEQKVRTALGIPEDYEMGAVTALGYPGDGSELPEAVRQMSSGPRTRKTLHEIVLADWNTPAVL